MILKKITSLLILASSLFVMTVIASPMSLGLNVQAELKQFSERLEAYNKARQEG